MITFNEENKDRGDRTLFFIASLLSIGAVIGLVCYLMTQSEITKMIFQGFTFTMVFHWAFYLLHQRLNKHSVCSQHISTLMVYTLFVFVAVYDPLEYQYMWVYLLYFPIILGLLESEKAYKVWSTIFILSYFIFITIHNLQDGLFAPEHALLRISQIFFAFGSILTGYMMVKHFGHVKYTTSLNEEKHMKEHIFEVLSTLVPIVETKSQTTRNEITEMSIIMKSILKRLPDNKVKDWEIEIISLLHFVSRIQWPDYLFEKNGKLTSYEFKLVQNHCILGHRLLGNFKSLNTVREAFLKHHERTNGTGYPLGLEGNKIPKLAQVLGLVECYLAMIKPRVYRPSMTAREALLEIQELEKTRVDSEILQALIQVIEEEDHSSEIGYKLVEVM